MSQQFKSVEDWQAEAVRRFGPDQMKWKFVCPSCGHVASIQDWKDAGSGDGVMALTIQESIAVSAVLDYLLAGGEPKTPEASTRAHEAAKLLVRHANKTLGAGIHESEVERRWPLAPDPRGRTKKS